MSWNDDRERPSGYNEYMTLGPYRFPHERDQACNELCRSGEWHMHSSDIHRETSQYFAIMARWVKAEDA